MTQTIKVENKEHLTLSALLADLTPKTRVGQVVEVMDDGYKGSHLQERVDARKNAGVAWVNVSSDRLRELSKIDTVR